MPMLGIKSPRLDFARLVVILTTIFAFLLLPVLMTNASAHRDGHMTTGHVAHEFSDHATLGHSGDHSVSDFHSAAPSPAENAGTPSNDESEHSGDECCSSFCSSAMISSDLDVGSKTFCNDFAARPLKALVSGEWVVPHRPPNT